MRIIVKHNFSGKEPLQNALINVLIARMEQICSVDSAEKMQYHGEAQNETNDQNKKEGAA